MLGERGRPLDELAVDFCMETVVLYEKIDGANARVICLGDDFIIGSREELLYASGDHLFNPYQGIVEALRPGAPDAVRRDGLTVYYLEVFGGNIGRNAKQYSTTGCVSARCFDVMVLEAEYLAKLLENDREDLSRWRDMGAQPFLGDLPSTYPWPKVALGHLGSSPQDVGRDP